MTNGFNDALKDWLVEMACDAKEFHDDGTPKMGKFETEELFRKGLEMVGGWEAIKMRLPNKNLTIGTELLTKDGRIIGNAIVTGVIGPSEADTKNTLYSVETDFGNNSRLSRREIEDWFYIGTGNFETAKQWSADRKANVLENSAVEVNDFEWIGKTAMVRGEDFTYTADVLCKFPKKNGKVRYIVEDNGRIFIQRREQIHFTDEGPLEISDNTYKGFRHHPETKPLKNDADGVKIGTYKHVKSGGLYILFAVGKMQANWSHYVTGMGYSSVDMHMVAIYRSIKDDTWWVRPWSEFSDGRFEKVE